MPIDTALEVGSMSRSVFDERSSRANCRTGNAVDCCTRVEEKEPHEGIVQSIDAKEVQPRTRRANDASACLTPTVDHAASE